MPDYLVQCRGGDRCRILRCQPSIGFLPVWPALPAGQIADSADNQYGDAIDISDLSYGRSFHFMQLHTPGMKCKFAKVTIVQEYRSAHSIATDVNRTLLPFGIDQLHTASSTFCTAQ